MKNSLSFKFLAVIILAGLVLAVVNPGNSATRAEGRTVETTQR